MECKDCKNYEEIIDELVSEITKLRKGKRDLFVTIRLLKQSIRQSMESEFNQADGFRESTN